MAWEQWIIPAVLLGGVGGMYYLMAKKGIGCCGSMMSRGCGMGGEAQEPPRHAAKVQPPDEHVNIAPEAPAKPTRPRRGTLVGKANGNSDEG
jgi:hypothetical protein